MIESMRKGEATKAKIIDEASRQAAIRGLRAVSLGDLAEGTGLSKSGVFKHFADKEDLQMAVLLATIKRFLAHIWTPSLQLPAGQERIGHIYDRWIDWVERESGPGGCPMMQASREFDDQPGAIRDYLKASHLKWESHMASELRAVRPALSEEAALQAAFDMKSYVLGFAEQRRLMDDSDARKRARASFDALILRLLQEPLAA
jgi:AcrR family transcriptional regulator